MSKPKLPLQRLIDLGAPDACACASNDDSGCTGYHSSSFENGVLTLNYAAANEAPESEYANTSAQFVEVGALLAALNDHDQWPAWRLILTTRIGVELHPYEADEENQA